MNQEKRINFFLWTSWMGILLNVATIPLALVDYYSWRESTILMGWIVGVLITITFIWNIIYLSALGQAFELNSDLGQKLNGKLSFLFLCGLATLVGFFFTGIGEPWGLFAFTGFYFFALVFQIEIISKIKKSRIDSENDNLIIKRDSKSDNKISVPQVLNLPGVKLFKKLFILLLLILYIVGVVLSHAQITGGDPILGQVTGAAAGIASGFVVLMMITITAISLKLTNRYTHPNLYKGLFLAGIIMGAIFCLPVVSRPAMIESGNTQFQIFGSDWKTFPSSITSPHLDTPFVGSQFYYGYSWDRLGNPENILYEEKNDILYFEHEDYQLYYDTHFPKKGQAGSNSLGRNTTIIVLHSGGWNGGDKGLDAIQVQNHLASQGYVIFDIQYRLLNSGLIDTSKDFGIDLNWQDPAPTAYNNVHGNYSISDMVSDVGKFTKYLASLTLEQRRGANLESVVLLGVSAGGHIGALTGYGYNHPWYAGNFSKDLTIKAMVLYNPPNDANYFFYEGHPMYYPYLIRGSPEQLPDVYNHSTPSNLIDKNSLPTLLFHGTIDKMVPPENSDQIYAQLQAHGCTSILINGPYGGHGFDFGPNFSPITTYYVERFLYQVLNK
jgi:acetyl esterase/lipase